MLISHNVIAISAIIAFSTSTRLFVKSLSSFPNQSIYKKLNQKTIIKMDTSPYCPISSNDEISYINASVAKSIDESLMKSPGFSLDTLMELAGYSVACAVHDYYFSNLSESNENREAQNVLVVCGPGNNGGDGLVASRHLKHFGFNVTILYPKQPVRYSNLVSQCQDLDIPIFNELPNFSEDSNMISSFKTFVENENIEIIVDSIFGFSFEGQIRQPFASIIEGMSTSSIPVLSVDIPSGWDVNEGDKYNTNFMPSSCISLTAPKLCMKDYHGVHYLGGRFIPPRIINEFHLNIPSYGPGVNQIMKISSGYTDQSIDKSVTEEVQVDIGVGALKTMFVTTSSVDEAKMIARALVSQKLAANVNLIPHITSIYELENEVEESNEVMMMIKTRSSLVDEVTNTVKQLHSYTVPESIVLDITGGSRDYIDWVLKSTKRGGENP